MGDLQGIEPNNWPSPLCLGQGSRSASGRPAAQKTSFLLWYVLDLGDNVRKKFIERLHFDNMGINSCGTGFLDQRPNASSRTCAARKPEKPGRVALATINRLLQSIHYGVIPSTIP